MYIQGKVVIITGPSAGIGLAVVRLFTERVLFMVDGNIVAIKCWANTSKKRTISRPGKKVFPAGCLKLVYKTAN
jgi:short-subunit dehydrogenase involved in D-alanine esterification of teichoic acids